MSHSSQGMSCRTRACAAEPGHVPQNPDMSRRPQGMSCRIRDLSRRETYLKRRPIMKGV